MEKYKDNSIEYVFYAYGAEVFRIYYKNEQIYYKIFKRNYKKLFMENLKSDINFENIVNNVGNEEYRIEQLEKIEECTWVLIMDIFNKLGFKGYGNQKSNLKEFVKLQLQ